MNWIHAAAITLRIVAGWNVVRVNSSRLTRRGLGVMRLAVSGNVSLSGTFRPNRIPALPMRGQVRSLKVPSLVRAFRASPVVGVVERSSGGSSVSCRFFSRSCLRSSTSLGPAIASGNSYHSLSLSSMDIGELLWGGGPHGHAPDFEIVCGEYVGAAATDTVMPRRIRVNGFIARRFMFPQKGSLSGSRRALAEKRGPLHSRTNDSQHLEGDFPPRRGEIAIELDGLFASEMNVERRSILAHVIGPGGLRDGQNVRLLQHP